jgi:hypothetical protein
MVYKRNKAIEVGEAQGPKDCCTADFIRPYLTLNKRSWASKT